jgi:hypothetical protein
MFVYRSTITLTVENRSEVEIDFLAFSFDDTHTSGTKAYLGDSELPPGELYEHEFNLKTFPIFSALRRPSDLVIQPRQEYTIDVSCFGKLGWCVITLSSETHV